MLKSKKKICSGCGKEAYIFSKGKCKLCQPKKPLKSKKKAINKISVKGKQKKEEKKEYLVKQFELFEKHWNLKPHYCESCGKWLGNENNLCFHDHLVEKSKRRDLALEIDNLFLVCMDCHNLKTNGFPTENHKKAIEIAKEKYLK